MKRELSMIKQQGLFVTGTDTNVGKTWVGQHLIDQLVKKGIDVVPHKPIESGWTNESDTDAYALAKAANKLHQLDTICPKRYRAALSPVSAARLEGQINYLTEGVSHCLKTVAKEQFLYVEGAGGFYSPLYSDGLNADLAEQLQLPVLLIAEDKLGCINHILLSLTAIKAKRLSVVAVVLNQATAQEDLIMDNLNELKELISVPIIPLNYQQDDFETAFKTLILLLNTCSSHS
ncbi:MAG: dethiobiotin synthase [Thiotrichaceae bacterium]|nr:dethiobiotin synthase [Thiotrichaceae bacterium]